jgi:hypothetical protein
LGAGGRVDSPGHEGEGVRRRISTGSIALLLGTLLLRAPPAVAQGQRAQVTPQEGLSVPGRAARAPRHRSSPGSSLASQRLLAAGRPPLGFVDPLLYRLGRRGGLGALRDIVQESNEVF